MSNALPQSVISVRGVPADYLTDFKATPEGGGVSAHRTLTAKQLPVAFRNGQRHNARLTFTFTMRPDGTFEFPFHLWEKNRTEFDVSRNELVDGVTNARTTSWDPVRIDNIDEPSEEDGVTSYTAECVALTPGESY